MSPGAVRMKERRIKEYRKLIRRIARSIISIGGAVLLLGITVLDGGNAFFSNAAPTISAEPVGKETKIVTGATMKLIYWQRTTPGYNSAYALLMWKSGNDYYHSAYNEFSGVHWVGVNNNTNPYISNGDSFFTRDYIGAPYFHYQDKDGDNRNAARYKIEFQNKENKLEGRYLYCDGDDIYRSKSADKWTVSHVTVRNGFGSRRIYYNRSAWYDTQLVIRGGHISSVEDTGDYFEIYTALEKTYGAIGDYTIKSGQVQRINNDVYQLDGTKLIIEDGAVMNVCGNFYYNGEIEVKGTLIVQDGGVMIPFSPLKAGGKITLKDGGTIIVKPKGRLLAGLGKGQLNSTEHGLVYVQSGNIINYGLTDICRIKMDKEAVIENHSGGRMFLGYGITKNIGKFQGKYTKDTSSGDLGLDLTYGSVTCASGSTIKLFYGSGFNVGNAGNNGQPCTVMTYSKDGNVNVSTPMYNKLG